MTEQRDSTRIVLWIVLGVVLLMLVGTGACALFVFNSPAVQDVFVKGQQMESSIRIAEEVRVALEKHVTLNNKWPNDLAGLKAELAPDLIEQANEEFVYTKPAGDSPDQAVVLRSRRKAGKTGLLDFEIEIDKGLRAWILTRQPLDEGGGFRKSAK